MSRLGEDGERGAAESVDVKARRYLTEGRVVVEHVQGDVVRATCRGGGDVYELGHRPGVGWH